MPVFSLAERAEVRLKRGFRGFGFWVLGLGFRGLGFWGLGSEEVGV